jgi:hypothetical protein
MTPPPITWHRPQVLGPHTLPKPRPADDRRCWFRVIARLRERTMLLLRRRCGRRVGEVSPLTWPAINVGAGSMRLNHGTGQMDRVGY